ncbi:AMP-dependent synthetase and ligase [Thermoanaerobacter kivui]|uniref:AMP-dependent synthetase and ligase n=1 Tax=Thermoanaerobacter kivui TaxID=2325 RepID=A0A097AQM0_THEKI|nr:phenylacetate--CoA ligase family protein [Thermoanaerobacter kivui]AIS52131.1 AMP-dependent synthetase and ligase [Thermoanaerobacter kivui]
MINEIFFGEKKDKIYSALKNVLENVPYYRENWGFKLPPIEKFDYSFFQQFVPILEKDEVRTHNDQFISTRYDKNELTFDVTSGTTGNPLLCYKSKKERLKRANELWKQRRMFVPDLSVYDRFARFYAYRMNEEYLITNKVLHRGNELHIPLFDYSEDRIEEYLSEISQFHPRWMHGPSTAIFNLAKHAKSKKIDLKIELIELNGEFVTDIQQSLIKEVFQCKVANHYGSREFWAMAYSCEEGHLHVLDESLFIESIYNESLQDYELVVTSLSNDAWPLIRYKIGDVGTIEKISCNSHSSSYVLHLKKGRIADYFTLAGNKYINAITFSGIIRGLSNIKGSLVVYQYQVLKVAENELIIKLCMNKENAENIKSFIVRLGTEIRKIIGNEIILHFKIVDSIQPDPKTGKCRDFVDLTKKGVEYERALLE